MLFTNLEIIKGIKFGMELQLINPYICVSIDILVLRIYFEWYGKL